MHEPARWILGSILFGMAYVPAAVAILTGLAAHRRIRRAQGRLSGGELATAGVLLGILGFVVTSASVAIALTAKRQPYAPTFGPRAVRSVLVPDRVPADDATAYRRYRVAPETAGSPDLARAYYAALRLKPSDPQRAGEMFSELLVQDPEYEPALLQRGLLRAAEEDFEDALRDFDTMIHLRPENAEAYALRARTLVALGERERALSDWERCIELDNGGQYHGEAQISARALRKELAR